MPKCYTELKNLDSFEERFRYLKLGGKTGNSIFGFDRYLNQRLYRSSEWLKTRRSIILRDCGCDLGIIDRLIGVKPIVHHIEPISLQDLEDGAKKIFDLENLILTSSSTHNAIHFGDESLLMPTKIVERKRGDTCPWAAY